MMERYRTMLKDFIHTNCRQMLREPSGMLKYPYTVPCSPDGAFYSKALWDWDSWLISIVLGQVEADGMTGQPTIEHEKGCILNYLDHTGPDGAVPILLEDNMRLVRWPDRPDGSYDSNIHKPVLCQHAAVLVRRGAGTGWLDPFWDKLEAFLSLYLTKHTHAETGLAFWQDDMAVGVDNDPSVFYRPDKSCGSIYLNSLLYRELLAYAYLLEQKGDLHGAIDWRGKAQTLLGAIQTHCWDERDGTFYSVDLNLRPVDETDWLHRGARRSWACVIQRIDNWSSFLPLWAGIATQEQAERMLMRYQDTHTFGARYGIRTLSRLEAQYSLRASHNPSNWRGPIWGISNYMLYLGLRKYGFEQDAFEMAEKTIELFGRDLERNGCLHEYYNPDTGEPIVSPGFQNWNFLVLNMIAGLEGRKTEETF